MSSNTALCGYKDRELQALKHELDVEVNSCELIPEWPGYDHEDLVYERYRSRPRAPNFCLEFLNVRGGEFLHE